jgi:hypothetical protein
MDWWLKTGSLKQKENTKQDQLHDNKETAGATGTSGIKGKLEKKHKYDDHYLQSGFTCVQWFQCTWCPLCIMLPNLRKQFHGS